jgi:hypothetical protein
MNGVGARPALQFFERLAELVEYLAVDGLDRPVRCQDGDEGRDAVDHLAKRQLV